MIKVVGPSECKNSETKGSFVNTTSSSREWSRGLSPFFLGPAKLYSSCSVAVSLNMENAWQYTKVYASHVGDDGWPNKSWYEWSCAGFASKRADRYPMGKGAKPEYSWWGADLGPLGYIEARKIIYVPLYTELVRQTPAYSKLLRLAKAGGVTLWDFDGWDSDLSFEEKLNNPKKKLGHAHVLAHMLEQDC